MKNKRLRTFDFIGRDVTFDTQKFKKFFYEKAKKQECSNKVGSLLEKLAYATSSEVETIRSWRKGNSGPSDIEKIELIADVLECELSDLLTDVNPHRKGENDMTNTNTLLRDYIARESNIDSGYSYFTKAAILKAYDMMTDFIYADDPEDIFGFISLAVKLDNMKGCIPDSLHEKIMNFTMRNIKEWMLYDIPDIYDCEDDDVDLARGVYDREYEVLRDLYFLAETEMEPYIGSKAKGSEEIPDKQSNSISGINQYKKIEANDISEERIDNILDKGLTIFQLRVNDDREEIEEFILYGYDVNGESPFASQFTEHQLKTMLATDVIYPEYPFKEYPQDKDIPPICIGSQGPDLIDQRTAVMSILHTASKSYDNQESHVHYEFYVSKNYVDCSKYHGQLELEFIESWMTEKGYYVPNN